MYIVHHFILLQLSPFDGCIDSEGSWFGHSMSKLHVWLSAEGAKNVSKPWLSPLEWWSSLTDAFNTVMFDNVQ